MSRLLRRLRIATPAALLTLCVVPAAALGFATSTEIEASSTRLHPGEWVSLTARTSPIPSSFPPEGTVTFYDGGTPIAGCDEMQIAGEGGATFCETPLNTPGKHQISASYTGTPDEEYEASSSGQITIEVGESTETYIVIPSSKVKVGQPVLVEAFTNPRSGLEESSDTFYDGGTPIEGCREVEVTGEGGSGYCETTFSTPGVHTISVSFSGTRNGEYFPSSGQREIEVEPAGGSEESEGKEGAKEPAGEEGSKAPEEPQSQGGAQQPSGPAPTPQQPVPLTDPFAPASAISAARAPVAPVLVSHPALLIINARRLRLAVRCSSPSCALRAEVFVYAGPHRWRLPATVELDPRPGFAHVVVRIPARDRGAVRAFLRAHSRAHRSIRVVLGEHSMTSTATLRLRTKPRFR